MVNPPLYNVKMEPKVESITAEQNPYTANTSTAVGVSSLTQAFQESIALSRLSAPEPSVFTGDSMQFIEWRSSFMTFIDKKECLCS